MFVCYQCWKSCSKKDSTPMSFLGRSGRHRTTLMNTNGYFLVLLQVVSAISISARETPVQFGSDRLPVGHLDELEVIQPYNFYVRYVNASRPLLIRGAMKGTTPVELWNDKYLTSQHGDVSVNVDLTKLEKRGSPSVEVKLSEFLTWYRQKEVYLISTLPESLQSEFPLPGCLDCKGFRSKMQDFVLWFSSGGSKSTLHFDNVENLYCQVDGSKRWIFVDPVNGSRFIPLDHPEGHYCGVNVSDVDYNKYPTLRNVPFWTADLKPGDCLYVPLNWWHQVTSSNSRNMAVNIWWAPTKNNGHRDSFLCDDVTTDDATMLSELTFTPGEWIRFNLLHLAEKYDGKLSYATMHHKVVHEHTGEHLVSRDSFVTLDENGDGSVDTHELIRISAKDLHLAVQNVMVGAMNINGKAQVPVKDSSEEVCTEDNASCNSRIKDDF